MDYEKFIAEVRKRGEYTDQAEAERATTTVLGLLGQRLSGGEAGNLAAQLPAALQDALTDSDSAGSFGVEDFVHRVAGELGGTADSARRDAGAVLSTVASAVTGGELNDVLTQLQPGYADLFGKPELS